MTAFVIDSKSIICFYYYFMYNIEHKCYSLVCESELKANVNCSHSGVTVISCLYEPLPFQLPLTNQHHCHISFIASGCDLHTQSPSCSPGRSCACPYWLLLTLIPPCSSESSCSDLSGSVCCAAEAWCPLTPDCARPSQSPRQATPASLRSRWHSPLLPDFQRSLCGKRNCQKVCHTDRVVLVYSSYKTRLCT